MVKSILTILLAGSVGLFACKSNQAMNDDSSSSESNDQTPELIVKDFEWKSPKDNPAVEIKKAEINGDILTLKVSYSGGCEDHSFELVTRKMFKKSLPPQLELFLVHENNGDACREIKEEVLHFDITNARYPSDNTKEVILLVTDGNSDPTRVSYSY